MLPVPAERPTVSPFHLDLLLARDRRLHLSLLPRDVVSIVATYLAKNAPAPIRLNTDVEFGWNVRRAACRHLLSCVICVAHRA